MKAIWFGCIALSSRIELTPFLGIAQGQRNLCIRRATSPCTVLDQQVHRPIKEALIKLIPFMARQAHHERNQPFTARPKLVVGRVQRLLK